MNLPIYRAKKIGSDEYVKGYYYKDNKDHIIFNGDSTTIFGLKVIDPTTIEVSINQKDWFSIEELNNILNSSDKAKRREQKERGIKYLLH